MITDTTDMKTTIHIFSRRGVCRLAAICAAAAAVAAAGCKTTALFPEMPHDDDAPARWTRTHYDPATGQLSWVKGDELMLFYVENGVIDTRFTGTATAERAGVDTDFSFRFDNAPEPPADAECALALIYPKTGFISAEGNVMSLRIPSVQRTSQYSYDNEACLLYGITHTRKGALPDLSNGNFTHVAAYGYMIITPPATLPADEKVKRVTISCDKPLAGTLEAVYGATSIESATVAEYETSLTLDSEDGAWTVMFACTGGSMADVPLTVKAYTENGGHYTTVYSHPRLAFTMGRLARFGVDMSRASLACEAGDVLWSEDFEKAQGVEAADAAYNENAIDGTYNPAAADASCRLLGGADRSALLYAGSCAAYLNFSADDNLCSGVVCTTRNVGSVKGYFSVSEIPLCGAKKVRLSFGTNASTPLLQTAFDGVWGTQQSVAGRSDDFTTVDMAVPEGAERLSFRIYGNSSAARRFDNFTLTVLE